MIDEALYLAREHLVKPFEGYGKRLPNGDCAAYPDPATGGAPWTIGFGSTGPDIGPDTVWTFARAEAALDAHLRYFLKGLLQLSPGLANATPRRLAALLSFVYNCGLGNYRVSTLRKKVNEEDWEAAQIEIRKWNKAAGRVMRGLTRRREAEALYLV